MRREEKNRIIDMGKLRARKLSLRFMLSFLLVLCLPIICFASIFMYYFAGIYREKLIEQAENTLATAGSELVRDIESLQVLVADDAFGTPLSTLILQRDHTGFLVRESLRAKRVNHLILDEICYYNPIRPNVVYTSSGTYSLDIFAQIYAGLENEERLLNQLDAVKGAAWVCWEPTVWEGETKETSIQYVVKRNSDEWWIFTLSNSELKQILYDEHVRTELRDSFGNTIFCTGSLGEQDEYELEFSASNGVLGLVRYVGEEELFAEFEIYQKFFILVVVVLLLIGGVLVLILTYWNEHPIREMQAWVGERMKGSSGAAEGLEIFRFAINEMEGQLALSESRQERNRLLLGMIYEHGCDTECFRKAVWDAGLFRESTCFRVILAMSGDQGDIRDKISQYLNAQEKGGMEIRWLDAANPNAVILIAGMTEPEERNLHKELLYMEDTLRGMLGRTVYFCVGGKCESYKKLHQSYSQALLCSRKWEDESQRGSARVFYYEKDPRMNQKFIYPDSKLKELEEALLEANVDLVMGITDALVEILQGEDISQFVAVSLYYDILNVYYKAQVRLDIDEDFDLFEAGLLEARDGISAVQMILGVREQYLAFVKKIQGQDSHAGSRKREKEEQADCDELVAQVLEFIEESVEICDLSVSMVADKFSLSISLLSQRFKKATGRTISDYITEKKFAYACELLRETDHSVTEIALLTGYSHPVSFIRRFKGQYGMTPVEYRMRKR